MQKYPKKADPSDLVPLKYETPVVGDAIAGEEGYYVGDVVTLADEHLEDFLDLYNKVCLVKNEVESHEISFWNMWKFIHEKTGIDVNLNWILRMKMGVTVYLVQKSYIKDKKPDDQPKPAGFDI